MHICPKCSASVSLDNKKRYVKHPANNAKWCGASGFRPKAVRQALAEKEVRR